MDSDVVPKIVDLREAGRNHWTVFFSNEMSVPVSAEEQPKSHLRMALCH
jgi:hypothetical protein